MSSARLAELLRQRALVSQHLAWLDAEIVAASDPAAPTAAVVPATPPAAAAPVLAAPASAIAELRAELSPSTAPDASPDEAVALANQRADEIIARHSAEDRFDPDATRRGCILFAVFVGCLLVLGVVAIYYFQYAGK